MRASERHPVVFFHLRGPLHADVGAAVAPLNVNPHGLGIQFGGPLIRTPGEVSA